MESIHSTSMTVEAALNAPKLKANLIRFQFSSPIDQVLVDNNSHWIDFSLTPRLQNARACYPDHWDARHFEPLGDIYFVPAKHTLHARGDVGGHKAMICLLDSKQEQAWFEQELDWTDHKLKASLDIRNVNIRNLLVRLGQEAQHPGFASEMMAELLAGQLVIELARHYAGLDEDSSVSGKLAPWRLKLIEERLVDLSSTPNLSELAKLCNLSVRQLTRSFRASCGQSIGDYVIQKRIEKAKLLLEKCHSVKQVAYDVGFSSPAAFSYAFRRACGESPGEYRKRVQN